MSVQACQESFIFFDHGSLIHDNSSYLTVLNQFCGRFTHCGYNNWLICHNLVFEGLFVLKEDLELLQSQLLDGLYIITKEILVITFQLKLCLLDEVFNVFTIAKFIDQTY